ncbi:MAG TPA: FIST N-terminal domain-containing protein [Mycobacteriales bacterium]|nr:FIST N-terminal domain-containing protein [Mycobacteriales bacterium]
MARFGDGLAVDADLVRAAERATEMALANLDGQRPNLMAVFVCGDDPESVAAALSRASDVSGAGSTIGCSAPGVIGSGQGVEASSAVAVWCAVLPDVRLRTFGLEVMPASEGMAVIGMPERGPDDEVAVILADPWSFPVDGFIEQSNDALAGLPIVGGMAAGARGRGSTRLLVDGKIVDRGAIGVMLGGPVGATTLVSQGCRPIGPAMTVTASDANVILELAGMPALAKLREILATLPTTEQALASSGLQLGVARDEYVEEHAQGDFLIRGIAGADEPRDALVVGDLIAVGQTVRFQVRDAAAADTDLRGVLQAFQANPSVGVVEGALLFSCNGRGAHLFGSADHDPALLRSDLVADGVAGCFAAGEIGPVAGRNFVHGFTASILAFGSATGPVR